MERRLVGILYADVVGYSRLMGADEAGTLSRLKAHRKEFIDPTIAAYQGRIVKIMGDGALVEFPSVVDAVDCAVDVQRGMVERNMDVSPHQQIVFRIGVNLGDVIIEGDDIYGDGVNVAARLEGLAEPGGICIPGRVLQQVEGKIDVGFAYLGEQSVKNIEKPVNAYKLLLDPADAGKTVGVPEAKAPRRRWPAVAACLVVLLAATGALAVWLRPVETPVETALAQAATLPLPDEPSIAVLAFDNLSGNPEYEIFSDGVTEDIITELARNQDLFVIARNSSFAYKGKQADIQQIARELGVQYVLEGSVRRAGDQVRITAQLIDAATGRHLWAESYDRQMDNLFAVQEDVIRNIAGVLLSKVRAAETAAAFAKQTDDLRAYDLLKQGIELKHTFTKETSLKAREVLSKALEIDPNYAEAWVYLGYAWGVDYSLALTGPPQREWLDEAVRHIQKGIALKPSLAIAYQALNYTLLMRGEMEEALAAGLRSVELNPNDSEK